MSAVVVEATMQSLCIGVSTLLSSEHCSSCMFPSSCDFTGCPVGLAGGWSPAPGSGMEPRSREWGS